MLNNWLKDGSNQFALFQAKRNEEVRIDCKTAIMKSAIKFDPEKTLNMLPEMFMNLNSIDQQIALLIYKTIANGKPATMEKLSKNLNIPLHELKSKLHAWPGVFINKGEEIKGFWGISTEKMYHKLNFEESEAYAWCTWDALFIPELVGQKAIIHSKCPVINEEIVIEIGSNGTISSEQNDIVVSFLLPDEAELMEDVVANFCHFIYFFSSRNAGKQWIQEHKGTYLLTLDDAANLSKLKNGLQFKDTLHEASLN